MRIISRKPLREFAQKHPPAKAPLDAWWAEVKHAEWKNFAELREFYGSADIVAGNRVIFNIGGNKYRLIVQMNFSMGIGYVRWVGTHREYNKIDATTV